MKRTLAGLMLLAGFCPTHQVSAADSVPWAQRVANAAIARWPDGRFAAPGASWTWNYELGTLLEGMDAVWMHTSDRRTFDYIKRSMDTFIGPDGNIATWKRSEDQLDHILPGRQLLMLYGATHEPRYAKAATLLYEQLQRQPRNTLGGFWHKQRYPNQMWLDGLYMAEPFYAEYAATFHHPEAFKDIALQFRLVDAHMRDAKTGLLYHGWDESQTERWADKQTGLSSQFWGRGMGWYMMALVDTLDYCPADDPGRKESLAQLERTAAAIAKYQDAKTGLWYQVIDKVSAPGNYLESSAACMFVYALAKGVRMGYLPTQYRAAAELGYQGVLTHFVQAGAGDDVSLTGTVKAAGLGGDPYRDGSYSYYIGEKVVSNDPKGVGAFLLATTEMETATVAGRAKDVRGAGAQDDETDFNAKLNQIAEKYLADRERTVQQLRTRAEVEARTRRFRAFVMNAIGGLPKERTPLGAQVIGTVHEDGFDVERVIYDSLPGFHVTANLYVPKSGSGQFPAVLYTPGHNPAGKLEAWALGANLARNGVAVLAYDPIGEGERLQYFDPAIKASRAGKPTGEHTEASVQISLTGEHIARYFLWDAMRGIDYLASRPDIDSQRIGAFGCSGGGTVTAYLAAFDRRVKAAGTACYITQMRSLLETIGPQEAEQTIPGFVEHGFDLADWIEAAAPTPYAVISTTEDMFPFDGARRAVEEVRRVYGLLGAGEQLDWITGPGRHGNLRPIYPQILRFFLGRLRGVDEPPNAIALEAPPAQALECTSTGQVATSLGGETLFSLNRVEAREVFRAPPAIKSKAQLTRFRDQLKQEVRSLLGLQSEPSAGVLQVALAGREQESGYTLEHATFVSATGQELTGALAVPDGGGRKAAVLLLDERAPGVTALDSEFDRLAPSGKIVFAPEALPGTKDRDEQKTELLGPFYMASLRAQLVGETLVGLRVEDVLRCLNWLAARPDVDAARISARAGGAMGIVLLHAALLDERICAVTLERTLVDYRASLDAALPTNLAQSVIPGVIRHYDLDDLMVALAPRPIELIAPIDGEGDSVDPHNALAWVLETDRVLGFAGRVKFVASEEEGPSVR
jgi:rhamnogalacturonyl hydrolase YesR/dienelactone hydrolase